MEPILRSGSFSGVFGLEFPWRVEDGAKGRVLDAAEAASPPNECRLGNRDRHKHGGERRAAGASCHSSLAG